MVLADLGADVIKIEAPGLGDYMRDLPPKTGSMSGRFLAVNRGKRSVVLDLKTELGKDAFLRMVQSSDVVVESFRPGVMTRLGIGFDDLRTRRDTIILCSISGYGQTGPYASRAGHDLNYVGTAGVLAMGGDPSAAPAMPGVQIGDLAGGALWGLSGILAALVGRERDGGCHLDISMTEGSLALLAAEIGTMDCGVPTPTRGRATLNGGLACYRVYRAGDGRYLSVAALEPKFWDAFNRAIGRDFDPTELVAGPAVQEEVAADIAARLATKTSAQWSEIFAAVDCCVDIVLELDELEAHPLHRDRGLFFSMETSDGPSTQVRMPIGDPCKLQQAPLHGEHTVEVLVELGFSESEAAALSGGQ